MSMNEYDLAKLHKKPINFIREQIDYHKKHPYDTLQPSDKNFKDVWGAKLKRNEDKIDLAKRNSEIEYEEKKQFKLRKKGYDKVHKKYHF